jgi:uncharacterized protein YbbK (DUF523 family)/uncharacterized protein YbgA (DUF1722 family)
MIDVHAKPLIAVSACLTGQEVRFNKGHKRNHYVMEELGKQMVLIPYCPEVSAGLPTPRPTIRIVDQAGKQVITGIDSRKNLYADISDTADRLIASQANLSALVVTQNSPSCGLFSARVYRENGYLQHKESGAFTQRIRELQPLLPIEEAGRLNDARLRESFISRVYVYHRWQQLELSPKALIDFHSQLKYQLMLHSYRHYKEAGKLLADLKNNDLKVVAKQYIQVIMSGLSQPVKQGQAYSTLQRLLGYFKAENSTLRQEITQALDGFRSGTVEFNVAIRLLHYASKISQDEYLLKQTIWQPYPQALRPYSMV